jgi:hypothetical protein
MNIHTIELMRLNLLSLPGHMLKVSEYFENRSIIYFFDFKFIEYVVYL